MIIDSAKYTCAGGHDINEDSYLCRGDKGIFIVADGLGGHSDGEKASMAAVDYFEKNCTGNYTQERVAELMEGANTQVLEKGDGGKTTIAAAFVENGRFIYANAGDSRVYFFHDGKVIAQTKDHSVCQASVDMGLIRPEDIRGNEDRSRLLKVLGGEERLNIKKSYPPIGISNGDAFLVCTDGFWDYVYETEMEADLLKSDSADVWLKYMLKRQILRAQNKGDNYTVICGIIHFEEGEVYSGVPQTEKPKSKAPAAKSGSKKAPSKSGKKKDLTLPIMIGVIAAAAVTGLICLFVLLFGGGKDGSPQVTTTQHTPAIAEKTTAAPNTVSTPSASVSEEASAAVSDTPDVGTSDNTSEDEGTSGTGEESQASEDEGSANASESPTSEGESSETT